MGSRKCSLQTSIAFGHVIYIEPLLFITCEELDDGLNRLEGTFREVVQLLRIDILERL